MWIRGHTTESWMLAEGCFITIEENFQGIAQFRTVSLLNIDRKIFLTVLERRFMTVYMLANQYSDVTVQKGGILGVSGCLDHISILTQIIREDKKNNVNIVLSALVGPGIWFYST